MPRVSHATDFTSVLLRVCVLLWTGAKWPSEMRYMYNQDREAQMIANIGNMNNSQAATMYCSVRTNGNCSSSNSCAYSPGASAALASLCFLRLLLPLWL